MTPLSRWMAALMAIAWAGLSAEAAMAQIPQIAEVAQPDEGGSTVLLTAKRRDGEPEHGAGVLLCQTSGKAYILTARHVVAGRHRPDEGVPPLPGTYDIEIAFSPEVGIPPLRLRSGERSKPFLQPSRENRGYDVLLLEVPFAEREVPTAVVGRPPSGEELGRSAWKVATHGSGGTDTWLTRDGELQIRDDAYLYHRPALERGFSGGPLLDDEGEVIGIYTGTVKGEEIGADPGADYGRAVAIDKAFELFAKALPGGCVKSNEESTAAAHHDYRLALRALNAGDLAEAERLLRAAIDNQDREGGSVHLQGLRYTRYLPHYHLGLALYRQSRRGGETRWEEARRELLTSKRQGVIAEDKRHRRLERYLRRCRAALEAAKAP